MKNFFQNLAENFNHFWINIHPELKEVITGFSKAAPALTAAASVAETLTGNAELIPLTQAAGSAAGQLGNIVNTEQPTTTAAAHLLTTVTPVLQAAKVDQTAIDHINTVVNALQSGAATVPTTAA